MIEINPTRINLISEGNGNQLQYYFLENPMDEGAWGATVHGVAELDMTELLQFDLYNFLPSTNFRVHFFFL